jgi:hypothetical protein
MPSNRTLYVSVTFNCVHNPDGSYGGTATYAQTGSEPADMGVLVDSDGSIHLDRAQAFDHNLYNENVDIVFNLASPATITPDNTTTQVVWATVYGVGATITVPEGGSATEFVVTPSPTNPNLLTITDKDDDSNTYNYKPAVELPALNNYYISLDPKIVNKPT